jgi:hypothetical protein
MGNHDTFAVLRDESDWHLEQIRGAVSRVRGRLVRMPDQGKLAKSLLSNLNGSFKNPHMKIFNLPIVM